MCWQTLKSKLSKDRESVYMSRGYFDLDGCSVYLRWGLDIVSGKTAVIISNISASVPGSGQFKSMIQQLEKLAHELGYVYLQFKTIQNPAFLQMLERNGYTVSSGGSADMRVCWDGEATKQLGIDL